MIAHSLLIPLKFGPFSILYRIFFLCILTYMHCVGYYQKEREKNVKQLLQNLQQKMGGKNEKNQRKTRLNDK